MCDRTVAAGGRVDPVEKESSLRALEDGSQVQALEPETRAQLEGLCLGVKVGSVRVHLVGIRKDRDDDSNAVRPPDLRGAPSLVVRPSPSEANYVSGSTGVEPFRRE